MDRWYACAPESGLEHSLFIVGVLVNEYFVLHVIDFVIQLFLAFHLIRNFMSLIMISNQLLIDDRLESSRKSEVHSSVQLKRLTN